MIFSLLRAVSICILFFVSFPLQIVIALCVLIGSGWPIFYRQKRVGRNEKIFTLYKFRTMRHDAEMIKPSLARLNESKGPVFKIHNDPRFTSVGKWLSHTGLDELPQLWNVLHGDMALFGPRPLPIEEEKKLKPWMRVRHNVLPGIISPAILSGRYHEDFVAWMKSDVWYAKHKTTQGDLMLLGRSVIFLIRLFLLEFRNG